MFDFAFIAAATLFGIAFGVHYKLKGDVNKKMEDAKDKYCATLAKFSTDSLRKLYENPLYRQTPPPDSELEKFYHDQYKKQFEVLDIIINPNRFVNWLSQALLLSTCSVICFLLAGLLPYISLEGYSVPLIVGGTIAFIGNLYRFYQVSSNT